MIVNCTPIGMHPNVDESPIHKTFLKPTMLVFDTVYNPESTLLIKDARSRNCAHGDRRRDVRARRRCCSSSCFTRQEAPPS